MLGSTNTANKIKVWQSWRLDTKLGKPPTFLPYSTVQKHKLNKQLKISGKWGIFIPYALSHTKQKGKTSIVTLLFSHGWKQLTLQFHCTLFPLFGKVLETVHNQGFWCLLDHITTAVPFLQNQGSDQPTTTT